MAVAEADEPVTLLIPEVDVHEAYVEILDLQYNQKVVTVIELVSPANKFAGPGRSSYLSKQQQVRASDAHLVEIDLLRQGPHVLAAAESAVKGQGHYDYLVSVNRAYKAREAYEVYLRGLRDRLPRIKIPLADGDPDVTLDLQAVLEQTYNAGSYRDRLEYSKPCKPPLSDADQAWANELIKKSTASA